MKFIQVILLMSGLFLFVACEENPAAIVYQHLETTVELERPFELQQEQLQKAEERENEIFEEIISLGMKDFKKIEKLTEEALESIESRLAMLNTEKESIEKSAEEFENIMDQVEKMDVDLSNLLINLYETMQDRYGSYHLLYDSYLQAINMDRKLFEALKEEELHIEELQEQINKANETYQLVTENTEIFNKLTQDYNEKKKLFYKATELNVSYELREE